MHRSEKDAQHAADRNVANMMGAVDDPAAGDGEASAKGGETSDIPGDAADPGAPQAEVRADADAECGVARGEAAAAVARQGAAVEAVCVGRDYGWCVGQGPEAAVAEIGAQRADAPLARLGGRDGEEGGCEDA